MTGLGILLALLLAARTLRRLWDRGLLFRIMLRLIRPWAVDEVRSAMESAGLRALVVPTGGWGVKAFLVSLPPVAFAVIGYVVQEWLQTPPWLIASALGVLATAAPALDHVTFQRLGYRAVEGIRSGREWAALTPALLLRAAISTVGFLAAYRGITLANAGDLAPALVPMVASLALFSLAHLPVLVAARAARRLRPVDFAATTEAESILFLRSFADDRLALVSDLAGVGPTRPQFQLGRTRFEELIAQSLVEAGPLVAIGRPGERLSELGAARTYWPDEDWRDAVEATAYRAQGVVMVAGLTEGLGWEIGRLREWGMLRKLLVLVPPDSVERTSARIIRVLDDLGISGFPFDEALIPTIIGFSFASDETPVVYLAAGQTWDAYIGTILFHRLERNKALESPRAEEQAEPADSPAQPAGNAQAATAQPLPPPQQRSTTESSDTEARATGDPRTATAGRLTAATRQVLEQAGWEAAMLGAAVIDQHHVLLALLARHPGLVSGALERPSEEIRRIQLENMPLGWFIVPDVQEDSHQVRLLLRTAGDLARERGDAEIDPQSLLRALLATAHPHVEDVFRTLGLNRSAASQRAAHFAA